MPNARAVCALNRANKRANNIFNKRTALVMSMAINIPTITPSTLWMLPANYLLKKLRSSIIDDQMGRHRHFRCPEIVLAVLLPPRQADPWSAALTNTFSVAWRLINKSQDRRERFLWEWDIQTHVLRSWRRMPLGPIQALIRAADHLGVSLHADDRSISLHLPEGPLIDMLECTPFELKNALTAIARRAIMQQLKNGVLPSKTTKNSTIRMPP